MKFFKKIFFLLIILLNKSIFTAPNDDPISFDDPINVEELNKLAKKMIQEFAPDMPVAEQEKLIETSVKDAIEIGNRFEKLPNSQKEAELDKMLSSLSEIDGRFKDFLSESKQEKEIPVEPEAEPVQEEVKLEAPVCEIGDIKGIKNTLETIISRIGSLLIKVKSMPRVSPDKKIEDKWNKLKPTLSTTESLLRLIVNKNKLLNTLSNKDYKSLENNLISLKDVLQKEVKFEVPDTAGLTITFEEDEDNIEFETSQKYLLGIINELYKILELGIIKRLKDFLEVNDPEELQKNPEILTNIENIESTTPNLFSGSNQTDQTSNLEQHYGRQIRTIDPDVLSSLGSLNSPINIQKSDTNVPSVENQPGEKSNKKGKKSEKEKVKRSSNIQEKKNESIDNQISEFQNALVNVSNSFSVVKTNILDTIEFLNNKSENDKPAVNMRDFQINLNELERNYDKALKIANKLNVTLNLLPEKEKTKKYMELLKNVYNREDLNLEKQYNIIDKNLKEVDKANLSNANINRMIEIKNTHDKIKEAIGLKKEVKETQVDKE